MGEGGGYNDHNHVPDIIYHHQTFVHDNVNEFCILCLCMCVSIMFSGKGLQKEEETNKMH